MKQWKMKVNVILCFAIVLMTAGCSDSVSDPRGFTDFEQIQEEYLETIENLNWPEGVTLPDKLEGGRYKCFLPDRVWRDKGV